MYTAVLEFALRLLEGFHRSSMYLAYMRRDQQTFSQAQASAEECARRLDTLSIN